LEEFCHLLNTKDIKWIKEAIFTKINDKRGMDEQLYNEENNQNESKNNYGLRQDFFHRSIFMNK